MPHPSCAAGYLESHVPTASQTGAPRPHKVDVEQLQVIMPLSSPLHPLLSPLLSSPLSPLSCTLISPLLSSLLSSRLTCLLPSHHVLQESLGLSELIERIRGMETDADGCAVLAPRWAQDDATESSPVVRSSFGAQRQARLCRHACACACASLLPRALLRHALSPPVAHHPPPA